MNKSYECYFLSSTEELIKQEWETRPYLVKDKKEQGIIIYETFSRIIPNIRIRIKLDLRDENAYVDIISNSNANEGDLDKVMQKELCNILTSKPRNLSK